MTQHLLQQAGPGVFRGRAARAAGSLAAVWDRPATGRRLRITFDQLAADLRDGPPDAQQPRMSVHVLDAKADQLAEPQTGVGQQRDDVALGAARLRERGDLRGREVGVRYVAGRRELGASSGIPRRQQAAFGLERHQSLGVIRQAPLDVEARPFLRLASSDRHGRLSASDAAAATGGRNSSASRARPTSSGVHGSPVDGRRSTHKSTDPPGDRLGASSLDPG
jgi:hypothetical protein